jgi:hypothetical protein
MASPSGFNPKPFLFRLLAAIFLCQFVITGWSVWRCGTVSAGESLHLKERCPDIGQRVENLFGLSLATVLSLLTSTEQIKE